MKLFTLNPVLAMLPLPILTVCELGKLVIYAFNAWLVEAIEFPEPSNTLTLPFAVGKLATLTFKLPVVYV